MGEEHPLQDLPPQDRPPPAPDAAPGRNHPKEVERLFREYNQSLLRFLGPRVRSPQDAKEIAQEAYVRLLNLDNPGAVSFLQAYLFKTALNIANERYSRRQVRERCNSLVFFENEIETADPPPERELAAQQELQVLRRAIDELPPKHRTAFILNRVEQLSLEETAQRMNMHPRHIRRLVADGLAHCLARLSAARGFTERSST